MTDQEWPQVRAEHERWLHPADLDADGGQRTPLRVAGVGGAWHGGVS